MLSFRRDVVCRETTLARAIQYAITALRRGMPVAQVASHLGLLPRTFSRRFTAQVGITPKRFARVQRLQRVLRAVRRSTKSHWSAVADQPYDWRLGRLVDPFGHHWEIGKPLSGST